MSSGCQLKQAADRTFSWLWLGSTHRERVSVYPHSHSLLKYNHPGNKSVNSKDLYSTRAGQTRHKQTNKTLLPDIDCDGENVTKAGDGAQLIKCFV